ncbi:predicted protein [Histoplasma mississippiense (nom. inval.)]|uniref:predicted protein n=1 Tax=Ajellomyces capsulatus (strain NAm1 / WU24) TaxID=2059318 RepID=UPI000157BBA3|nr:predicted protein [Histoplasma mississippiense (nom. inval.)]EDN04228.1 predicted protein [Histoplasma mississippiense (nom. inval.)]
MRDAAVHMQQPEDTEAVSVQGILDPDGGNDDVWVSQRLREFNVDADDQEAVIEFLGQKVEGQGIEHNQLVEMFCWLRGIYQEAERGKMESEVKPVGPKPVGRRSRWTSNPSQEGINPLGVEHAGPNPLDVKPVGRQTRPRSALTRWKSNTLSNRWGWNGRPFHSGLENRPIRAGQIGRRSGYEIQHIQIKSDNSAGKGLHCGVKVNELSRTRWTLSRWTSNPSNQESEMESQQGETHIRFNSTCSPRMARSVSKSTDNNINESITKNEASTIPSSVGLCKISVVSLVYIIRDLIE